MTEAEIIVDLKSNGIVEGSVGHQLYKDYRNNGLNHKQAVEAVIDGIQNLRSQTMDEQTLRNLKEYLKSVRGQFF